MADWVTARSKCSMAEMLVVLRDEVLANIVARNEILDASGDRDRFKLVDHRGNGFAVVDTWSQWEKKCVDVRVEDKNPSVIVFSNVTGNRVEQLVAATVTLNDELECKFKVGDDELEPWQVAKRGLEGLFFNA
jgi:hypothetical protein